MIDKVKYFKNGYLEISDRIELLKLEEDIKEFMRSKDYRRLSTEERDALDELHIDVINKKEYFKTGLDPGKMKKWLNDSKWRSHE